MGVSSYPRIHFRGTFTANPATADNDDVAVEIDPAHVNILSTLSNKTDAEVLAWLKTGVPAISIINQKPFVYLRGGWNPFGDLTTKFIDVRVCSTVDSDGLMNTFDPLIGSWLSLNGSPPRAPHEPDSKPKLCDLDPTGSAVTQLFLGGFRIGDATLGLEATCDRKAFCRWVSFRNAMTYPGEQNFPGAGAVWQFAIPKEFLEFHSPDANASRVLADLHRAAGGARGIVVQFATFQVVPTLSDSELIAILQDPRSIQSNPATGLIVGTVGVWEQGESATVPGGRLLLAPDDRAILQQDLGLAAAYLGPATAHIQRDRNIVSLNLISTFPENGYDRPLVKADFGRVCLGVILPDSNLPIAISGSIDYDYPSYELTSGIIDVEYDPAIADRDMLDQGTLVLLADPGPQGNLVSILTESELVVTVVSVGPDDTGVYLDIDEYVDLSIVVTERGGPPTNDVTVYLWEFQYVTNPGDSRTRALSMLHQVGAGIPLDYRLGFEPVVDFPAGTSDPLVIRVNGEAAGGAVIAFTLDNQAPSGPYPWGTAFYTGFRVLPNDDYSEIDPLKRVSWDFMYQNVFRYYRLIFPAMSTVVPFDDQRAMEAAAKSIVAFTDPGNSESTRYMPVSRDLSTGKRDLIVEWYQSLSGRGAAFRNFFWP